MKVFFFMCRFPIKLTKICNNNKNDNNSINFIKQHGYNVLHCR